MDLEQFLSDVSLAAGVSGYESGAARVIEAAFRAITDEIRTDALGNLIMFKRGAGTEPRPKIMLAAHMDEIGLIVTRIEEGGFIRFSSIGGVDQRILPAAEVIVHGKKDLPGVVGAKPPHVQEPEEREKAAKMEDLFIDVALPKDEVEQLVSVGDMVTLKREAAKLCGSRFAAKAMDDRSGAAVMYVCCEALQRLKHSADVYFVATVQEEVGIRGAVTSTFGIVPDVGIAIDVGHGDMAGVPESDTIKLGKGPGLGIGPHVHPKVFDKIKELADNWGIDYSLEPVPYPGGTDAYSIQVTQAGIPTMLFSIPLRYMHTPVETLDVEDLRASGRLLALFISEVDASFVEGLRCY